ncbi:peptidoglycan DD-metalloendopeptidase family protein [Candidatus Zixiibacteriota bacterium]
MGIFAEKLRRLAMRHFRRGSAGRVQNQGLAYLVLGFLVLFSIGSAVVVGTPRPGNSRAILSWRQAVGGEAMSLDAATTTDMTRSLTLEGTSIHIVEDGDDLWTLASDYGTYVEDLVRANGFSYARQLKIGQQLCIPPPVSDGSHLLDLCRPHLVVSSPGAGQLDWPPVTKTSHTVRPGENIWLIARQFGVDVPTIFGANEALDGGYIFPGDEIVVPSQKGILVTVKAEKSLAKIADRYRVPLATVARANRLSHDVQLVPGQEIFVPGGRPLDRGTFIWPLVNYGRISSGFGYRFHPILRRRLWHSGIDLTASYGTPIRAARSGRVISSGWNGGLGKTVILKHDQGFETIYGHCSRTRVSRNQYVKKGQTIATVGKTGLATGPHLHFEVRKSGRSFNPLRYLPFW